MPFDLTIPGQTTAEELSFIERIASRVPPRGKIVELGSLFGRSALAWSKSVDPTVTIYCVDPWKREHWIEPFEAEFAVSFGVATFHKYTASCTNIVALPGYSPTDFTDWNLSVDVYFDDSVHTNPVFRQNLDFWIEHVKPGGIMCGHDYNSDFPDIVKEVDDLAKRLGVEVEKVGFIWMLQLPNERNEYNIEEIGLNNLSESDINSKDSGPELPSHISSMMKKKELDLLYKLTRFFYTGNGEIVDLGPFLGSSTFMLIEGLLANPLMADGQNRVFSFDQFIYEPYRGFDIFLNAQDLPTFSFFSNFQKNLEHRWKHVYCSPGDLMKLRWNQNPVEILFIDAAKNVALNQHIIHQFFGALRESKAIIVQQDYFYYGCPWIIVAMEHFSPWLRYVGSAPGATAYFQSLAKIPQIMIQTPVETANNAARQTFLLEQAAERQMRSNRRLIIDLARAYNMHCQGARDHATEIMNSVQQPLGLDEWATDAQWNLNAIKQELNI